MKPLKIAFAGTGYISKIHARAVKECGAELVAVVNHRPTSRAQFAAEFDIPRQYRTVEAMLVECDVEALVISTPNYLHAPQTIAALDVGVHVLVEKPMAMDAVEAILMGAAAEKSGATLMVAHCWRFDPEVLWLKAQVDRLGKIVRTKGYGVHTHWGPSGWFTQKEFAGGGALADMGIHALDTARFLLGDPQPVSVYAHIGTYYGNYDVDDTGVMMVNWDNGVVSYIESGWWQPHSDGREAATQLYGSLGFGQLFPTRVELANRESGGWDIFDSGFPTSRENHMPQSLYNAQMQYFIDCIQNKERPVPGAMEGLVNMKLVDAAYESARTGKVVEVKV